MLKGFLTILSARRIANIPFQFQPVSTRWFSVEVKHRADPIVMKLDSPHFKALYTDEVKELQRLFELHNYELRVAGGAVRDLLLGQQPKDIDFATTATPQEMKAMFAQHGVRMINTNGERHGTITPRILDKVNFEVTTLRIDVVTDGRHAQVQFTTDWRLDAERRDLTINSMFLGLDGTVYDYFNGYEDLQHRRVRFVGDADRRIQEDYLRILRYFRFYGRISESPDNHDTATLEAIRRNGSGLEAISGERVWSELSKVLSGPHAGELTEAMLALGLGTAIGLPQPCAVDRFREVWLSLHRDPARVHPVTLLCGLLRSEEELLAFHARVKLSSFERDLGTFVISHRDHKPHPNAIRPYQSLVIHTKSKVADAVAYVREVLLYRGDKELLQEWDKWTVPRFPVNGNMIRSKGVTSGIHIGLVINKLKEIWISSDFKMTADELMEKVNIEEFSFDVKEKGSPKRKNQNKHDD